MLTAVSQVVLIVYCLIGIFEAASDFIYKAATFAVKVLGLLLLVAAAVFVSAYISKTYAGAGEFVKPAEGATGTATEEFFKAATSQAQALYDRLKNEL